MRRLIALPLILLLAGCPMPQNTGDAAADSYANAVRRVGLVCDSYTASLNTLTVMRDAGQLSNATRASISNVRTQVGPICTQQDPPLVLSNGRDTIAFIEPLIYQLLIYKGGAP